MREGQKRATTKVVARSCDAPAGPPISWVPPLVPPSPSCFPPSSMTQMGPHPSAEGRGTGGLQLRGWSELGLRSGEGGGRMKRG